MKKITISVAGLAIGIEYRYDYVAAHCRAYLTDAPADFTVCASEEEIRVEAGEQGEPYYPGAESIVIYRQIARRLPAYDACVFHAAVIAKDGTAYAVTAKSGTGKTTHIRLWLKEFPDAYVLNGDKPILRLIDGVFCVCGTPWQGKERYGVNEILPLGGIAFLTRASENSAVLRTEEDAVTRFLPQIFLPEDPLALAATLDLADRVLAKIPLFEVFANMEPDAAHAAYAALSSRKERKSL